MIGIVKFLGGREGEETRILLLLGVGFFTGIFVAFMQAPAEGLFMSQVGAEYADKAFFLRGGLGVISASAYVFLQRHMKFSTLSVLVAITVCLSLFALRLSYEGFENRIVSFVLFIMFGPIVSITLLSFWGIFGRMFDVRAAKRVIGGIDTGQLFATLLSFFVIIALRTKILDHTVDLIWVSCFASLGALFMILIIVRKYDLNTMKMGTTLSNATKSPDREEKVGYGAILSNRYYRLLSAFLILSVAASAFNEFSYLTSITRWYEGDEANITVAVSSIDALVIIVGFLVQSFVNDYIISKFGLKVSLMVMPIFLGVFTIGSIVAGHAFGYEEIGAGYFLFFSFNVMGRILTASLRDSLENPAFKTFFFPLDARIRYDVQSRIEGVVNQVAEIIAGGALILFGLLLYFKFIYFSYVTVLIVLGCIYLASKLFESYKISLRESLSRQKRIMQEKGQQKGRTVLGILQREIESNNHKSAIFSLKVMERTDPIVMRDTLIPMLRNYHPAVRSYAYHKCGELNLFEKQERIRSALKMEAHAEVKKIGERTLSSIEAFSKQSHPPEEIKTLIFSEDEQERKKAVQLIRKSSDDITSGLLRTLIRDAHPEVRTEAILSAGQMKFSTLWAEIIGNLHLPTYSNVAKAALIKGGESSFQPVDLVFYRTNQHEETMLKVIQVIGRIGGKEAIERLWRKIDFPNQKILNQVVLYLNANGYQATKIRAERMKIQIEAAIGNIAWNLNAISYIQSHKGHPLDRLIIEALQEENEWNYESIFSVMSIVYDLQSVELVRENIELDSVEGVAYAMELMSVFLDEDIKPRLFPLYDDLKLDERLSRLSDFYALDPFRNYQDLLYQLIHRDYEKISRWAKGLALYRLQFMKSVPVGIELQANLFNPDRLLLQTTAHVIYKKDRNAYKSYVARLPQATAKWLDATLIPPVNLGKNEEWKRKLLRMEIALFLNRIEMFKEMEGSILAELADVTEEKTFEKGEVFVKRGDSGDKPIYVIFRGEVDVSKDDEHVRVMKEGLIGLRNLTTSDFFQHTYKARTKLTLLVVRMEHFFNLAGKHPSMVESMLKYARQDPLKGSISSTSQRFKAVPV
ncbi:MAG: cyclic nucleotide-binding domain-containing protein [Cytophagales bacterium]|nr:cyclic nucleotide-binding domain-containing protein [Cytophagales bacterium]